MFTSVIDFNLAEVEPSVAGPKRPQDRIGLETIKSEFLASLTQSKD